jgi:hypothetical protein
MIPLAALPYLVRLSLQKDMIYRARVSKDIENSGLFPPMRFVPIPCFFRGGLHLFTFKLHFINPPTVRQLFLFCPYVRKTADRWGFPQSNQKGCILFLKQIF